MRKNRRKKKVLTFGDMGFSMKVEASNTEGDVIIVSKNLWIEIAEMLIEADEKIAFIAKEIDTLL